MKDDFEKHLSRQTFRRVPDNWKAGILDEATQVEPSRAERTLSQVIIKWAHDLLWPSPVAWAGLVVVWMGIGVMNHQALKLAENSSVESYPVTEEMIVVMREQRQWVQALLEEEFHIGDPWDRPKPPPVSQRENRLPLLLMTS